MRAWYVNRKKGDVMKALVFQGPGRTAWQDVPEPAIKDAADAIVRVDAVTICGTDLHIVKGDVPEVAPGTVLGPRGRRRSRRDRGRRADGAPR